MFLQHSIELLAHQLVRRMIRPLHAIIQQEIRPMVDAVADLTAQADATLATVAALVAEVQKDVAALAALPKDNTDAIEAQVARLKAGSDAAAAALAAIQNPPVVEPTPAPVEQPAPTEATPEVQA